MVGVLGANPTLLLILGYESLESATAVSAERLYLHPIICPADGNDDDIFQWMPDVLAPARIRYPPKCSLILFVPYPMAPSPLEPLSYPLF